MSKPRFDYVELPTAGLEESIRFYEAAFGWNLARFGPTYAATTSGDTDIGLQADPAEASKAPLPVIRVEDVDAAASAVEAAGADILRPIFSFPGGRRFHFRDPSGNEIAVWQTTGE